MLFRNLFVAAVTGVGSLCCQPVAQGGGDLSLQRARSNAGLKPPKRVQPVGSRLPQNARFPFQHRFGIQGNPERRRIWVNAISKESRRRDANNGDRTTLNEKSGPD